MSDSHNMPKPHRDVPVDRPSWRFSGRRGTPVHLREKTDGPLPREIREALVEITRERSQSSSKASSELKLPTSPVSAAPVPVERRSPRTPAPDAVSTYSIAAPSTSPKPVEATPADLELKSTPPSVAPPQAPEAATSDTDTANRNTKLSPEKTSLEPPDLVEKPKPRTKRKKRNRKRGRRTFAADRIATPTSSSSIEPAAPTTVNHPENELPEAIFASIATPASDNDTTSVIDYPAAEGALIEGRQSAWELGRLPFLLPGMNQVPSESPEQPQTNTDEPSQTSTPLDKQQPIAATVSKEKELPVRPRGWKPTTKRIRRNTKQDPIQLRPIDWLPLSSELVPAPIEPIEPQRATPAAISDLARTLPARAKIDAHDELRTRPSTPETPSLAPAARAAEARHRLLRHQRSLDDVVSQLASYSSSPINNHR